MNAYLFTPAWLALGACGSVIVWADDKRFSSRIRRTKIVWCPTPRAIFFMVVFSVLGGLLFIASLALCACNYRPSKKATWWNSPICKQKDNDNA